MKNLKSGLGYSLMRELLQTFNSTTGIIFHRKIKFNFHHTYTLEFYMIFYLDISVQEDLSNEVRRLKISNCLKIKFVNFFFF